MMIIIMFSYKHHNVCRARNKTPFLSKSLNFNLVDDVPVTRVVALKMSFTRILQYYIFFFFCVLFLIAIFFLF